jgi:hypothetical protein
MLKFEVAKPNIKYLTQNMPSGTNFCNSKYSDQGAGGGGGGMDVSFFRKQVLLRESLKRALKEP